MAIIINDTLKEIDKHMTDYISAIKQYNYGVEQKLLIQLITAQNETNRLLQELTDYLKTK